MAITELPERIESKIERAETGCWVWRANVTGSGYGYVWFDGKVRRAHRVVYQLLVGAIPEGLDLDHLCRNRTCVNPAHLEPVTRSENNRRGLTGQAGGSVGPVNLAKKKCPQGHPYTHRNAHGRRVCRTCLREAQARYRAKNRPILAAKQRERGGVVSSL